MKVEKILVPLDGSSLGEAALPKAIELAMATPGASIVLLRAAEAPGLVGPDPIDAQVAVVQEVEVYLDEIAGRVRREGVPTVTTSVWYGPPAPAIVKAADTMRADLIVMSTHGRTGIGRLVLGSVTESVLRATHVPILLLRPTDTPVERPAGSVRPPRAKEVTHV